MLTTLCHFLNFDEWANRRVIESVRTVPAARAKALGPLAHLLTAERAWLERILGDDSTTDFWPEATLDDCVSWLDENRAAWDRFSNGARGGDAGGIVSYRNSKGVEYRTPLSEILTHLLTHGAHHRGQVLQLVREEGGSPIPVDYIVFVREVEGQP